jgi:hypothetical protein
MNSQFTEVKTKNLTKKGWKKFNANNKQKNANSKYLGYHFTPDKFVKIF